MLDNSSCHVAAPIPTCLPPGFISDSSIPHVGQLMHSSFLQPIHTATMVAESNIWWFSEMYAGVRACWVAESQTLGVSIPIPNSYVCEMKKHTMDVEGKLWSGRGYTNTRKAFEWKNDTHWCYVRFVLEDYPSQSTKYIGYEERCKIALVEWTNMNLRSSIPFIISSAIMKWDRSVKQLQHTLCDHVLSHHGEGIVFKRADSLYLHGGKDPNVSLMLRASNLLSTNSYNDLEEEMGSSIRHLNGISQQGYQALIGLLARRQEESPEDVSATPWKGNNKALNGRALYRHRGYWTHERMRQWWDSVAGRQHLDGQEASTWYRIPAVTLRAEAPFVRDLYRGSAGRALVDAYPSIGLDPDLVDNGQYWTQLHNRKLFFDQIAKKHLFDPLGSKHKWYSLPLDAFLAEQGGAKVLSFYGGSVVLALKEMYPSLKLHENSFAVHRSYQHY